MIVYYNFSRPQASIADHSGKKVFGVRVKNSCRVVIFDQID